MWYFLLNNNSHNRVGICDGFFVQSRSLGLGLKCIYLFLVYSKLPYDVTPEQAMSHEEVRNRLEASIKNMRTVTDKFLSAIVVSVDKIP